MVPPVLLEVNIGFDAKLVRLIVAFPFAAGNLFRNPDIHVQGFLQILYMDLLLDGSILLQCRQKKLARLHYR
jgi:hypothetical protein